MDVDSSNASILIVAAEASSCMYAKSFIKAWRRFYPDQHFFGIGDKEMHEKYGVESFGFAEDLAVVGLQEVISHWPEIKASFNGILGKAEKSKPLFALLLDYPGFNLRLAKKLKAMDVPVVYYISPQLWAWKKGRVKQVRKYVDDMLVVFPFEVDFYRQNNIEAHFVGHPLVEVVDREAGGAKESSLKPVLGLMPGSRKSEIKFNWVTQLQTAQELRKKYAIDVKVLVAPTLEVEELKERANPSLLDGVEFIQDAPTKMIQKCDLILTASGTATLQVALCQKPMVVMYKMNPITALLARLLVRDVDAFCIVNLIAGRKIVPEFFQGDANSKKLSQTLAQYIEDGDIREQSLQNLLLIREKLGAGHATDNVVQFLQNKYGVSF